jgi:cytochrome c553
MKKLIFILFLTFFISNNVVASTGSVTKGKKLYERYCSKCHWGGGKQPKYGNYGNLASREEKELAKAINDRLGGVTSKDRKLRKLLRMEKKYLKNIHKREGNNGINSLALFFSSINKELTVKTNNENHAKLLCQQLTKSAERGNIKKVTSLIKQGAKPTCKYTYKSNSGQAIKTDTPTYFAGYFGHTDITTYLVSQGGLSEDANRGNQEYLAKKAAKNALMGVLGKAVQSYLTCEGDCPSASDNYSESNGNSNNHSSSGNTRKNNPKNSSSGIKRTYYGGVKSSNGHKIYITKCISGSSFSAFQKPNGFWYDDGGSNYGDRFRNLSLHNFANKKCKY